ncbi:MAG: helix-turn-helix transcriptional regulator [Isosphaeraceae bacterium]
MSKSAVLRAGDARAIVQLVNDCRDRGDDWGAWQSHALEGLIRLTDSELGIGGEVVGARAPKYDHLSPPLFRSLDGFRVDMAELARVTSDHDLIRDASPLVSHYMGRWREQDGVALTNRDFFTEREWANSYDQRTMGAVSGTDAVLICCREVRVGSLAGGEVQDLTVLRERRRRGYSARDRTIAREFVAALVPMMGGPLARFREPSASGLPPRARDVLACFLEGDSDKQAAKRLGIGVHTVNQHAKRIFRHFGVASRAELLARWIRRGWSSRPPGAAPRRDHPSPPNDSPERGSRW